MGAFKTVWRGAVIGGQVDCHFTIPSIACKPPLPHSSDFHLIHYEEAGHTECTWLFCGDFSSKPHKPQLYVLPYNPI